MGRKLNSKKTVDKIKQSFIKLLQSTSYTAISVKDISGEAMINRTTFYLFYENKSELALEIFDDFTDEFLNCFNQLFYDRNGMEYKKNIYIAFGKLQQYRNVLLELLFVKINDSFLYERMQSMISEIVYRDLQNNKVKMKNDGDIKYMAEFLASTAIVTVKWWLTNEGSYNLDHIFFIIDTCLYEGISGLIEN